MIVPDSPPLTLAAVEDLLNSRRPETQISPTTARMVALMDLIGNPQHAYPVIQIAGTNGKTSTARMIDALVTRIGLRTGRFTSPHLQLVTERISLDGAPISEEQFVSIYSDIAPYVDLVDAGQHAGGRHRALEVRDPHRHGLRGVRGRAGRRGRSSRSDWAAPGTRPTSPTPRSPSSPRSAWITSNSSATRSARSPGSRPGSSRRMRSRSSPGSNPRRWMRCCVGPSRSTCRSPGRAVSSTCWSGLSPSAGSG